MNQQISKETVITFVLPGVAIRPSGGLKIVYEYANRLVRDGYKVNIVYPALIGWKKSSSIARLKMVGFGLSCVFKGWRCDKWFRLDNRVKQIYRICLKFNNIPESDIYIATEARTAPYVNSYPVGKSSKYYFIQALEDWVMPEDELFETFRYPLRKIVISKWLNKRLANKQISSTIVPNGFDFEYFKISNPIESRDRKCLSMMYSESAYKDALTSIEALKLVHEKYPDIRVLTFGVPPRPDFLPEWFIYFRQPDKTQHNKIYNDSSIYVASAVNEGWGLTVGEAMMCGAAVVCSEIDGYKEMAEDGKNALLFPPKDSVKMAERIEELIENDSLRQSLASQAYKDIQKFSTEKSYKKFKSVLGL